MPDNVNYTIKFLLSDLYHNNGLFEQGVLNNRYQQDKWTPVPSSIQSLQGANDKLQESVSHINPCELLYQYVSKGLSSIHYAKTTRVRPLTLWTSPNLDSYEQLRGHIDKHIHNHR